MRRFIRTIAACGLVAMTMLLAAGCKNTMAPPPPGGGTNTTDSHTDALSGGPVLPLTANHTVSAYNRGDSTVIYKRANIAANEVNWYSNAPATRDYTKFRVTLGNHHIDGMADPIGVWVNATTVKFTVKLPANPYLCDWPTWYNGELVGYDWVGPGGKNQGTSFGNPISIDASGNPSLW